MKVDVLKLEKRLDDCLYYLRDAPPECSTIPFDFESVPHPPGAPVPINPIKVCRQTGSRKLNLFNGFYIGLKGVTS